MGSKSAATSPTGSLHSTPTHQAKPQTLDPFADLGSLGANLAGLHPLLQKRKQCITSILLEKQAELPGMCGASQPTCMPVLLPGFPFCLILCKLSQIRAFPDPWSKNVLAMCRELSRLHELQSTTSDKSKHALAEDAMCSSAATSLGGELGPAKLLGFLRNCFLLDLTRFSAL